MCHMAEDPFAPYQVTDETVHRPDRRSFEPRYEIEQPVFDAMRAVERADQELSRGALDRVERRRLIEEALTRNAYGTASIEGNPLTLADVESLLERGHTPELTDRPEEREILNYVSYMEDLEDHGAPRTVDDILDLHAALFEGVLADAGRFKEEQNFIGRRETREVIFVPASPERVELKLANALAWLHEAPEHPLIRAQVFFHELQSIHPFRDGNGRTGRAVTTLLLHGWGYEGARLALVDYELNEDRDGYYQALSAVERQGFDYTPWITYFSGVLQRTFEGAVERVLFRTRLPEELNQRQTEVAFWFARMDAENPGRRVKFNDVHAAFPQVADRTLKRDLKRLREAEVIEMEGQRKAARYHLILGTGR